MINSYMEYTTEITDTEIKVSSAARAKFKAIYADAEDGFDGIRLFIAGSGCSGLTTGLGFATEKTKFDKTIPMDGVNVYVDVVALHYLQGVEIDFGNGISGERFIFNNLFASLEAAGSCNGCGSAQ
jgi:iron-sulfur cluster assembly accessory protein